MTGRASIGYIEKSLIAAGVISSIVILGAVMARSPTPFAAARSKAPSITIVSVPTRTDGNGSSVPSLALASIPAATSAVRNPKDHVIGLVESRMLSSWDVTGVLHNKFESEARDDVWADAAESMLASWRKTVSSSDTAHLSRADVYCASTVCEMVISPPKGSGFHELNQISGDLEETDFADYLSRNGLKLAATSSGVDYQNKAGIVLILEKKI